MKTTLDIPVSALSVTYTASYCNGNSRSDAMTEPPPRGIKAGDKYGKLTAMRRLHRNGIRSTFYWEFRCDCGEITEKDSSSVKSGRTTSCGCIRVVAPWLTTARYAWHNNYDDGLSFEDFLELSQLPCHYCNTPPSNLFRCQNKSKVPLDKHHLYEWRYSGLDRVDSSRDHARENVVPCCTNCNKAKMALSYQEFLELVERIYNHRIKPT